jgi:hypothetical protein
MSSIATLTFNHVSLTSSMCHISIMTIFARLMTHRPFPCHQMCHFNDMSSPCHLHHIINMPISTPHMFHVNFTLICVPNYLKLLHTHTPTHSISQIVALLHIHLCRNPTLSEVWGRHSHSRKWDLRVIQDSRKLKVRLQGSNLTPDH